MPRAGVRVVAAERPHVRDERALLAVERAAHPRHPAIRNPVGDDHAQRGVIGRVHQLRPVERRSRASSAVESVARDAQVTEEHLPGLHISGRLRRGRPGNGHGEQQNEADDRARHDAEHGVGLQAEPSGTFLKCELVTKRDVEILRILDDRRHDQPRVAVRLGGAVEVLGQPRVRAVGHAVLPQSSRAACWS